MSSLSPLLASEFILYVGGSFLLLRQLIKELSFKSIDLKLLTEQIYQIGVRSLPLIAITALSTGMVMTLQFGISLAKFGGAPYVPKIISLSVVREMGPVFTSLMIAARVGAGFASEIGSMVVTQQIDAIRALGTSPIKKIVIPRVLGCIIALPILAALANIIGILGAMLVSVNELNLDSQFFILKVTSTVRLADFISGFSKTFFFAAMISVTSCYFGLNVKEGAKEVGSATTKAVVFSSILVLVGDYFLTKLFWIIETLF
jgi:phospholipid/cholesterol/gamma-HCH transport system permease protein